tara:strand:+ start:1939 stop:2880 length:942 start_codon:yes stop_codon:yes gene_type:complete
MKYIKQFLMRIIFILALIIFLCIYYFEKLNIFFKTNPTINSIIIIVLISGVIFILRQFYQVRNDLVWMNNLVNTNKRAKTSIKSPTFLKYLDYVIKRNSGKLIFSQSALKAIMESLEGRIVEIREISRYIIGLTIFLGLLGTFWGLLETINSVSLTVKNLDFSSDTKKLFDLLKQGLEQPLGGMGTAFSSSLFGLSGSLILGFLDLQNNQMQNRFYNDVEEKLTEFTKFSFMTMEDDEKNNLSPAYVEALIEVTTENLKKSTSVIDKQNKHQESISKSIHEVNKFLSESTSLNTEIRDEIKILSKTISNISKK